MGYAIGRDILSPAEAIIAKMAKAYRAWRNGREFERFSRENPFEVERLAQDLNVERYALLAMVTRGERAAGLLHRRLRMLGLNHQELVEREPAVARDLARCCALCESKSRCARDLARGARADWKDYCLNEPTLEALKHSSVA